MKRSLVGLLLFILTVPGLSQAAPHVLVTLKPVHSLVAGVMAGAGTPELLVKGAASPHDYVLRPSEARALSKADLIIWVGSGLEGFLVKPLQTLGHDAQSIELTLALKDKLLPARRGGNWEQHSHHHDEGEHAEDHDDHDMDHDHADHDSLANYDQHLWLNPHLAKEIVTLTADKLSVMDPANVKTYSHNRQQLIARLDQLDQQLSQQLHPVQTVPYVVFHAAYQYFEAAYNLHPVGSISIDPDHRPGARRVKEIRDKIMATEAKCVFSEPQFESRLIATLIEGTNTRTGILDPLGADLKAGPEAYFELMEKMGKNLFRGLTD